MSRRFAILLLGLVGAVSVILLTGSTFDGAIQVSPYFMMAGVVPLVLRQFDAGRTYRQFFMGCFSVGLIMTVAQLWWIMSILQHRRFPWFGSALPIALMVIALAFGSALVAAVSTPQHPATDSAVRFAARSLALSFATFALTYGALSPLIWPGLAASPISSSAPASRLA